MRIVLIGDIHTFSLWTAPWDLLGKRALGQANLWLRRRRRFNRALLEPTVSRAASLEPDLVLLSGDLTTTALTSEFVRVARALEPLTDRVDTVVVPGNHDRYTFTAARSRRLEQSFTKHVPTAFPQMTPLCGRWRLLAIDSSVPRVLSSRGRVGARQREEAAAILEPLTADDGLFVLTHYPLSNQPGHHAMPHNHQLEDADAVMDMLAACPARTFYVHGHIHRPWVSRREEPRLSHVTDVNAGAPVMCTSTFPHGQGFWLIDLPEATDKPVDFHHHTLASPADGGHWNIRTTSVPAV